MRHFLEWVSEWGLEDSNLRRLSRRVYSPFPLAARAHPRSGRHCSFGSWRPTTSRSSVPAPQARPRRTGSRPRAHASSSSTRRRSRATSRAAAASRGARGGYGWVFPKLDHVNVGVGGNAEEGPRLRRELRRMCEAYGIDPDAAEDTRGYRLPLRLPGTQLARGRTAVIGDAAGLVDPFSGDGMYEAFLSAQLVAEAALAVLAGREQDLSAYQAAVEQRIAPLTRAASGAKRAFERFPRATYALARLPVTFRALEKLLQGELPEPA